MPATIEALFIAVVFVMPGVAFVPLWFLAAGDLLDVRSRLISAATVPGSASLSLNHRGVVAFFALAVLFPIYVGFLAATAYWLDSYPRIAGRVLPRVGVPAPARGIGEASAYGSQLARSFP